MTLNKRNVAAATFPHPRERSRGAFLPPRPAPRAFTLVEVMVVMVVVAALTAFCIPSFQRALEQSRADVAVANLRAVWAAQRLYWLEYHAYAGMEEPENGIAVLESLGLLDLDSELSSSRYTYYINAADENSFTAVAERTGAGSDRWNGSFTIDENGNIGGNIGATGASNITPSFQ